MPKPKDIDVGDIIEFDPDSDTRLAVKNEKVSRMEVDIIMYFDDINSKKKIFLFIDTKTHKLFSVTENTDIRKY